MLSISNISKYFGEQELFSDVTFNVGARDRIALIGPNGSGKTTLFEIITGNVKPDSGNINMRKDVTIGYSKQEITPFSEEALLDNVVRASTRVKGMEHRISLLQEAISEGGDEEDSAQLLKELGELQHKYELAGGYNVEHEAEVILCGLGFKKSDFYRPLREFSGGWLMRVGLSRLLILNPDLLLLDEPTNHLDLESCVWFEDYLKNYQGAVMVTSHDRAFLNRIARKIIAIEKDEVAFYHGNYDEYIFAREQDLKNREATAKRQEIKIKKEMRFIEKFRSKATKAAQVQSRIKQLDKVELVELPEDKSEINIRFTEPPQSGRTPIKLISISKSYGEKKVFQ